MCQVRPIPGYSHYFVTEDGQVFSMRRKGRGGGKEGFGEWRIMRPFQRPDGHLEVHLRQDSQTGIRVSREKVHRLVLFAFVGPCPAGMECRHLNGNPQDNRVSNLRWGTHSENSRDAVRHGTCYLLRQGERHPSARLHEHEVLEIERMCRERTLSKEKIAARFGIGHSQVSAIGLHRAWPYLWDSKQPALCGGQP
jgi:hypothetical protein